MIVLKIPNLNDFMTSWKKFKIMDDQVIYLKKNIYFFFVNSKILNYFVLNFKYINNFEIKKKKKF